VRLAIALLSLALLAGFAGLGVWVAHGRPDAAAPPGGAARAVPGGGPPQQVQAIAFEGGRGVPQAELRGALATRVGDLLDAERLERDRSAIEDALAARGYLAAKVPAPSVTFVEGHGAFVVFDLEQGPQFLVRAVVVSGPGRRESDAVRLTAGDVASRDRLARARDALADRLGRRGTQVELRTTVDVAAAAVDVELATR
jgi:outer membrane protein assembly factor BamA